MGFGAYGVGPYGFCGCWGSLYKHRRITLGKKLCVWELPITVHEGTANMVCNRITQRGFSHKW